MLCKLCAWLRRLFPAQAARANATLQRASRAWERDSSNEWDLWSAETDHTRALAEQAMALPFDSEAAFRLYLEAAEAGSAWSMEIVAKYYRTGTVVAADFEQAQAYYRRALSAGSQTATIRYAKLLAEHDLHDECEAVLEDGVRASFVPAYFWLAWFRHKRSPSRATRRAVRPLLEHAAAQGHPNAKVLLVRWMISGEFGLRAIPRGFRLARECGAIGRDEDQAARQDGEAGSQSSTTAAA